MCYLHSLNTFQVPSYQNWTANVIISQHKTRLHYSPLYFYLEHIGLWSQTKDGMLSPEQTTAKVNCELRSHYLQATAVARSPFTLLVFSPCVQLSAPRLAIMTEGFCSFPQSFRTNRIRYISVGTVTRLWK